MGSSLTFSGLVVAGMLAAWAAFPGSAASQAPAAPAAGDAATLQLIRTVCTTCHEIGIVTAQHKSPDQWNATLEKMIGLGAQVTDEQAGQIADYLAKTYPSAK